MATIDLVTDTNRGIHDAFRKVSDLRKTQGAKGFKLAYLQSHTGDNNFQGKGLYSPSMNGRTSGSMSGWPD